MNTMIKKTLVSSVSRCITELGKFKNRIENMDRKNSIPIPENVNSDEYFTSSRELANYLHCSDRTITKYCSLGIFPYAIYQGNRIFKIDEIDEIVDEKPICLGLKLSRDMQPSKKMRFSTRIRVLDDHYFFVYINYLGWHCTLCLTMDLLGNKEEITSICREIIKLQHKVKPFNLLPNEN